MDCSNTCAMRVCHPGPEAFQRAIVSGGSRNDRSLRALGNFGRPLRTSFCPSYRLAPEIHDSVISGGSTGLAEVRPEPFRFALMAMSHADDASGRASRRPDKNDESGIEPANRNETRLAVVSSIVDACEVESDEDLTGTAHVESALLQRLGTFRSVAGDAHD